VPAFWNIAFTTLLWPIVLPMHAIWHLMEYLYSKFTNNPKP